MKVHVSTVAAILLLALSSSIGCVVPVGSIVPYGGTIATLKDVPEGWLLCNGAVVSRGQYGRLAEVIGTAWGNGNDNNAETFNLPDLRGMFLRGVDHAAGRDKNSDEKGRPAIKPGGNKGDRVGSQQDYATALPRKKFWANLRHAHPYVKTIKGHVMAGGDEEPRNNDVDANTDHELSEREPTTDGGGDDETRPKNVYVNFIIKY